VPTFTTTRRSLFPAFSAPSGVPDEWPSLNDDAPEGAHKRPDAGRQDERVVEGAAATRAAGHDGC